MNRTVLTKSDEAEKYLLYAKLDNAKVLYNLVKTVSFKDVCEFCFNNLNNKIKHFVYDLACNLLCTRDWFQNQLRGLEKHSGHCVCALGFVPGVLGERGVRVHTNKHYDIDRVSEYIWHRLHQRDHAGSQDLL